MFKKLLLLLILTVILLFPVIAMAVEPAVNIYFFESKTCPHCAKEKEFLKKISAENENIRINDFEISNPSNALLLQKIGIVLNIQTSGVPITIIGNTHFVGYYNDEATGQEIISLIEKFSKDGDPDLVGKIIRNEPFTTQTPPSPTPISTHNAGSISIDPETPKKDAVMPQLSLPIIGSLDTKNLSLPVLTFVIALADGFNPCAMWTLLFLISLLLGMKDRKRMWILGTAFICSSAFVYFLFLSAWLNLFLFLGFIFWVRILIGLVALSAGGYNLRDYYVNKSGGCNVMGNEKRQKIFEKIRSVTQRKQLFLALGGIVLLAFAVNLVELICSAGLPAIYTQILSLSKLPVWQYYLYLLLYIFIFMLDDLFVFFTAMITLQMTGIQNKYSRVSHLIGGILMLIIGLLLLFKPELLMFGV